MVIADRIIIMLPSECAQRGTPAIIAAIIMAVLIRMAIINLTLE